MNSTMETVMGTNVSSGHDNDDVSSTQMFVIKFFSIYVSVLGTIGNSLTIIAILKGKLHHQSTYIKILNLSIINFILCAFFLPLITVQTYTGLWTNNATLCNIYSFGLFANLGTELLGCVCITLNRYLCVVHNRIYTHVYNTPTKLVIQLLVTWLVYPIILAFPLFGIWSHYEYAPGKLVCHPFLGESCTGYCLFVFIFVLASTLPVITYCYMHIMYIYFKVQRKLGFNRDTSRDNSQNSHDSLYRPHEHHITRAELKMAFTILAVVMVFGIFRMPFAFLYMYDPAMVKIDPLIHTIVIHAGTNANWINPLIYAYTNRQIRKSLKTLLPSCFK